MKREKEDEEHWFDEGVQHYHQDSTTAGIVFAPQRYKEDEEHWSATWATATTASTQSPRKKEEDEINAAYAS